MKKQKLFGRLLIPTMIALILLPPLSCLIFSGTAKQYAYHEARKDLATLQQNILPLMKSDFLTSDETGLSGTGSSDEVRSFLGKVGPLVARMGGDARLMILESRMHVIYPRDEAERAAVTALAGEFAAFIQSESPAAGSGTVEFQASNGETYLVNIFEVPTRSVQIQYLIAYCSTSQIGGWVKNASILVLAISSLFVLVTIIVLFITARGVTRPLHRLCREAERIGSGSFTVIEPDFSLAELEDLRLAMNQMSDRLMHADAAQKNFFQNVSHELRNPLMSISGYAQGIEQGVFPSPKEAAHTILEEGVRLTGLVDSLLTLSRMETDEQQADLSPVWLADSLEDCLDRFSGLALQKGVSLFMRPFDRDITAYCEEELLFKVLHNLLTNAIRYAKKAVTVSVAAVENQVIVSVADDGDSIFEKDLPHLFERGYKGKGGNFGIGLSIAHVAALKMEGNLMAANQKEGGAVFTLILRKA